MILVAAIKDGKLMLRKNVDKDFKEFSSDGNDFILEIHSLKPDRVIFTSSFDKPEEFGWTNEQGPYDLLDEVQARIRKEKREESEDVSEFNKYLGM